MANAVNELKNSLYIDNVLTGGIDLQKAKQYKQAVTPLA